MQYFNSNSFKYLLIGIFLIPISSCKKSDDLQPSNCYYSDEVDALYREDAQRLLFYEIYSDSLHEDRDKPFFDEYKIDLILNAFQAVYDLDIPARDSVVEKYNIHVFPWLGMRSISLQTDTASEAVKKLIQGETTGNDQLDDLISKYHFSEVTTSLYYPDFNWITITAEQPLNLIPFIQELESFPFFYKAGFGGGAVGDGNTIELTREGNILKLDYSIGWGDCPAGCIYRKHWVFAVDDECHASFLQTYEN